MRIAGIINQQYSGLKYCPPHEEEAFKERMKRKYEPIPAEERDRHYYAEKYYLFFCSVYHAVVTGKLSSMSKREQDNLFDCAIHQMERYKTRMNNA